MTDSHAGAIFTRYILQTELPTQDARGAHPRLLYVPGRRDLREPAARFNPTVLRLPGALLGSAGPARSDIPAPGPAPAPARSQNHPARPRTCPLTPAEGRLRPPGSVKYPGTCSLRMCDLPHSLLVRPCLQVSFLLLLLLLPACPVSLIGHTGGHVPTQISHPADSAAFVSVEYSQECRQSHVKCDKLEPRCRRCAQLGLECHLPLRVRLTPGMSSPGLILYAFRL